MNFWVNRSARPYYVSAGIWWTRYHLLARKIYLQGCAAPTDRRAAEALLRYRAAVGDDNPHALSEAKEHLMRLVYG